MLANLIKTGKSVFSIFKKKVAPLKQQGYESYKELYTELTQFESGLTNLQLLKMPKKLQEFEKKFKRLSRTDGISMTAVPMKLSHTFQYFTRMTDTMIFGTEQTQKETTLDQLNDMLRDMHELSLETYQSDLIPVAQSKRQLFETIQKRFITLQQRFSRHLFKGYYSFSRVTQSLSFLQERQYKGDFKFQLVQDLQLIEKASEGLYYCARFNHLRNKLILACEQAVSQWHQQLSQTALARYLYCLAVAGRSVRKVEKDFTSVMEKLNDFPIEILLYMLVNQVEDTFSLISFLNSVKLRPQNSYDQFICRIIKMTLQEKTGLNVELQTELQTTSDKPQHEGELFFEHFLERYHFDFSRLPNELTYHSIYDIQEKNFMVLDPKLVSTETLKPNGFGILVQQYYVSKGKALKHINWPRIILMEKRTQKDQYVFSKFKGIEKPKIKKVRYYD